MRHEESDLQCTCVRWFGLQYPKLRELLYAVPNGGFRNPHEAMRFKMEGVRAGVPDLCLAVKRGEYGALYVELKTKEGRLSEQQKNWAIKAREAGGQSCATVRSFDEFREVVNGYLIEL